MTRLVAFLSRLPATRVMSTSDDDAHEAAEMRAILAAEGIESADSHELWWAKLSLDIRSHLAWHVIQELGHVLNYVSLSDRLPTVFMPTSSPPALNGGPDEFLHWVIESTAPGVDAGAICDTLIERLPRQLEDLSLWRRCENEPCEVPRRGNLGSC